MVRQVRLRLAFAALLAGIPAARAQFAVIDVASLTQLVSEVQTLGQQLATARSELAQAQAEYQSVTGTRGMEQLLAGTTRNYLPSDWATLQRALQGGGNFPTLAADLKNALGLTAVLSGPQLSALAPSASAQLQAGRESVALLQSLSHEALANASNRFASLQRLIDAIGGTADQKGILELQARIAAEQGMLVNEHTKLQVLYQALQAEEWASAQRVRELALAGHGQFASRFQPHP
jgi:type IV secretion system protein VirB5